MVIEPRDRLKSGWTRGPIFSGDDPEEDWDPHALFRELAGHCAADAQFVEIVGMEEIDTRWLGEDWPVEKAKQRIREEVVKLMVDEGKAGSATTEKAARIVFMTREEFEARERPLGWMRE